MKHQWILAMLIVLLVGMVALTGCIEFNSQNEEEQDTNRLPVINLIYPIKQYDTLTTDNIESTPPPWYYFHYRYNRVAAYIQDPDGDEMNIQFWKKDANSDEWVGIGNFLGYNGTYQANLYPTNAAVRWLQVRIDASDGHGTTTKRVMLHYYLPIICGNSVGV